MYASQIPQPLIGKNRVMGAEPQDVMRANTYGLLAALLAKPLTAQLLDLVSHIDDEAASAEQGAMASAWKMLALAARRATLDGLDDEYHDLFIGIGRGEVVPYGSWYMTGFLLDKPLVELRNDLQALGIERQDGVREPEDHVAALCETMSMIINDGAAIGFEFQRRFFSCHVEPWMGLFFADLQQATSAVFYRAVGHLGQQFLEIEQRYLGMPA